MAEDRTQEVKDLLGNIIAGNSADAQQQFNDQLASRTGEAIDSLAPEDKWIFNTLMIERLSLRTAGAVLGIPKTSLARRRDKIRRELMTVLIESEVIQRWLKRDW